MSSTSQRAPDARLALLLLLLLFVGSGCAALIYEIVWLQLLQIVIGSTAVSLGVLLGTFMGGMCLGSWLLPWAIGRRWHPLRVYAALEIGIGALGAVLIFALPRLDELYAATAAQGWLGVVLRAVLAAACLLPPTLLMGATLPAVARWVEATPRGIAWLGFFYGGNIAGAVLGCLLAGFYLLRLFDMQVATCVAVAINALVALLALALSSGTTHAAGIDRREPAVSPSPRMRPSVLFCIGLSGLSALGAEVVWTRLLSLLLGGTVYTFSIILAVFLTGLGLGSSVGSWLARGSQPRLLLGTCQLLLAAAIAWAAWVLTQSLPYWPINPALSRNPWDGFQLDLLRCLWVVLPAAGLWGASFPLALAAAASPPAADPRAAAPDAGKLVGSVYAANTLGAITGALAFSLVIVGALGTRGAQRMLIGVSLVSALLAWLPPLVSSARSGGVRALGFRAAVLAGGAALAGWLAWRVPPTPGELIAYGRFVPRDAGQARIAYLGEGTNASVAVSYVEGGAWNFHVSGKIEASSEPQDMRLQRMLGHIPAIVHPQPRSVLVVGCGAGVTAGSFVLHPGVERIVICEIEPLIPQVIAGYFEAENYGVVHSPKVSIVHDDARHYVLTTRETFDVITSDPIHPWVKGAATLYTREYFELCRRRLNQGGVITQWVPLYESNEAAVKSELATFFAVFPQGTIWSNSPWGHGYDVVLLGQVGPLAIDVERLTERLARADHQGVAASLGEVGLTSVLDVLSTYAGDAADLGPWLADAQINRDSDLRLQYLAGFGASNHDEAQIHTELLRHRRYPDRLFVASPATEEEAPASTGAEAVIALTHFPSPGLQAGERTYVPRQAIDGSRVAAEHAAYCRLLEECGMRVRALAVNRDLPDAVFIEDTAVVLDEVAVLCSMGAASRRAEPLGIEPVLREYREVERVTLPARLEGGDVLRVGKSLLVGMSSRTDAAGAAALTSIAGRFGYTVTTVPVRGSLHLKTACGALPDGRLLVNPAWIDVMSLPPHELVHVPGDEPWGANVALVGDVVLKDAAHVQTVEQVRSLGFTVRTVDLSELARAEGGVTCLALLIA